MGKYPLSQSEKARFERMWDGLSKSKKATVIIDFDQFCAWLKGDNPSFFNAISHKLYDLWKEIKSNIGDFAEGVFLGTVGVAIAPVAGLISGIEEGCRNGVEAGVKEAINSTSKFLKQIFK